MMEGRKAAAWYDEWADWYEDYMNGEARAFAARVGDALTQVLGRGAGPLLDLACGTGTHVPVLAALGWTPLGLDVSMAQLR
jgi:SAM-dependent methyltransferase